MSDAALPKLKDVRHRHRLRNTYRETMASLTRLDSLAVWITEHVGTMGFFLLILA